MRKGINTINPFSGVLDEGLNEMVLGDKVILLERFAGSVVFECGAYGIGFDEPLDWDYIESQIEPVTGCDNQPAFCKNDNFVSLWELLWNFNCEDDVCVVVKIDFDARQDKDLHYNKKKPTDCSKVGICDALFKNKEKLIMMNPESKNCPVNNCDTLQHRDKHCAALQGETNLAGPTESTPYNLEYKGVRCVEVNWEKQVFTFDVNGEKVVYKQPHYIESSADTDHIRMVIDLYLDELAQKTLHQKAGQDVEDAKAIIRLIELADENTTVRRSTDGKLYIGVRGCWRVQISRNLFPSLPARKETTLKAILKGYVE